MDNFAYEDLLTFLQTKPKFKDLVAFHSSYKYFIYTKSHASYKELGKIVANHDKKPMDIVLKDYKKAFLYAVCLKSSTKNIYNVLLHIFGYFKHDLGKEEKAKMQDMMLGFKNKNTPLSEAIGMFNIYVDRYDKSYLKTQKFLKFYS